MRSFAVFLVACVWTLASPVMAADLTWHATIACERRERVASEVERLLGQPLAEVEFADFQVELRQLRERELELQLAVTPRNPALDPSSRTLVAASCEELAEAAALAIAMTVSAHQAEPVEPPPPPAAIERVEEPAAREPVRVELGAGAALDVGMFPRAAIGAQVRAAVRYRWFALVPFGVFFPRSTSRSDDGAGAEFRAAAGGALACAGPSYAKARLDGCLGYEAGKLHGRGTGLLQPRAGESRWSAPRAELQLGIPLVARVRLTVSAGVAVATVRRRFEIDGGLVHRPGAVTGRFGLGIDFEL